MMRVMHRILPFFVALAASTFAAAAFPANETSYVNVYIPAALHSDQPNGIRHKMSNFGRHPAIGSLDLPVYFYFRLCEFPVDSTQGYPPRDGGRWEPPFILMTPRGGCTFAAKARHAQMAGASALIIADTTCLCDDENCKSNNTWKNDGTCEAYEPTMADDGSGGDISIPGFLLYKDDATPLVQAIVDKHQSILMKIRWHKPQSDSVHFGLWMDILDDYSKKLFQDIGPIVNALGDRGTFFPHYMLHNGTRTNCGGAGGSGSGNNQSAPQLCENMCTNNGRYCYPTHRRNGTAVVMEILRRACIWKHHGPTKGDIGAKWWQYVLYFGEKCGDTFTNENCMHEALKHAEIPKNEVENCIIDSGDPTGDDPNTLLDAALRSQIEYGIVTAPRLWASHRALDDPTADALLAAICDMSAPLRRACIWKHHGPTKGDIGAKWWQYVLYFGEKCGDTFTNENCMHEALKHAEIPKNEVENCIIDSGDPTGDDPNTLLDAALRSQIEYGIVTAPRLWASHRALDDPTADALLAAICDMSAPGSEFSVCKQCLKNKDPVACVAKKYGTAKVHSKTFHILLWSGLLVSVGFFTYAYKRYQEGDGAGLSGLNPMAYAMLRDQDGGGSFEPATTQL